MQVKIELDYEAMSERAARVVAEVVRSKPNACSSRMTILSSLSGRSFR